MTQNEQFGVSVKYFFLTAKPYMSIGCYHDHFPDRVIPSIEGDTPILDGHYRWRTNRIEKCYQAAVSFGFKMFALQDGGECRASNNGQWDYWRYGDCEVTNKCKPISQRDGVVVKEGSY